MPYTMKKHLVRKQAVEVDSEKVPDELRLERKGTSDWSLSWMIASVQTRKLSDYSEFRKLLKR